MKRTPDQYGSKHPSKLQVPCSLRLEPTSHDEETVTEPSRDGSVPAATERVAAKRFIPRFLGRSHPSFQSAHSHIAISSRRAWEDCGKQSLLRMMEGSRATPNIRNIPVMASQEPALEYVNTQPLSVRQASFTPRFLRGKYSHRDEIPNKGYSKNTPHTSRALAICEEEERTSRKRLTERTHSEGGKRFKPTTGQPSSGPNPSTAGAPEKQHHSPSFTHQYHDILHTAESPAEVDSTVLQPLSTSNPPKISLQPPSLQNVCPSPSQTSQSVKELSPQNEPLLPSQTPEPVNERLHSLTPQTSRHQTPSPPRTPIPSSPLRRSLAPPLPSRTPPNNGSPPHLDTSQEEIPVRKRFSRPPTGNLKSVAEAFRIAEKAVSQDSPSIPHRNQRTGAPSDTPGIPRRKDFPSVVNLRRTTPSPDPVTTQHLDPSHPELFSSPGWVHCNRTRAKAVSRGKLYRVNVSPRCFNNNYFNVEPIVAAVFRERINEFISTFQGAMSRECEYEELESEFTREQNRFEDADLHDRWRYSVMHETAACIIRDTYKSNIQRIPYYVKTRAKSKDGLVVDVVEKRSDGHGSHPWSIQPYDVVLDSTRDEQVLIGMCFGAFEGFTVDGDVFIILDWYKESSLGRGLYRIGNYRQHMSTYGSLRRLTMPTSTTLQKTVKILMTGQEEERRCLIDLDNNSSPTPPIDGNAETAIRYVSFLEIRGQLNVEQSAAVKKCFWNMRLWCRGMEEDDKSPLQQFLAVTGVPGCGKTHTAVYMIATLIIYRNPETLRREGVPYWGGQTLVLTKTNRALDVFMDRIERIQIPSTQPGEDCSYLDFPYYCRRSLSYTSRPDVEPVHRRRQLDDPKALRDVPLMLSTFGSLFTLFLAWRYVLGSDEAIESWVRENFKMLIIDEGSQCTLLDLLGFLDLFPSFDGPVVFMGDHRQMGPVVFTTVKEAREMLTTTMFSQLSENDALFVPSAHMNIQYRMHRDIMNLANDVAYDGKMVYGRKNEEFHRMGTELTRLRHTSHDSQILGPVIAYTTSNAPLCMFKCEEDYVNYDELKLAEWIISTAVSNSNLRYKEFVFLSPYNLQCDEMRKRTSQLGWGIRIQTVATFQGQEGAVVIYSLVRREGTGTGFLDRNEILNVAITRAVQSLIIIGDLTYFKNNLPPTSNWNKLLDSLQSRGFPTLQAHRYIM